MSTQKAPYLPQFPYTGPQVIISSDRVVVHSKGDSIFLFGKNAIGLSSPGRVNIDTQTGTTINAPEIELGLRAKQVGQPVTKADTLVELLDTVLKELEATAIALSNLSQTNLQQSIVDLVKTSSKLQGTCTRVRNKLVNVKSKTTYTL
jgi:hypothetical protein